MLSFTVAIRSYAVLIFFNGITLLAYSILFIKEIVGVLQSEINFGWEHIFALSLIFLCTMSFLWLSFGEETISFSGSNMFLLRSNKLIKIKIRYELNKITDFKIKEKKYPQDSFLDRTRQQIHEKQNAMFFWTNMGNIYFEYNGKTRTFFNGLSSDFEKKRMVSKLNEMLKKSISIV